MPIDPIEVFLNEHRADLAAYRIILTVFLLRLVGQNPPTAREQVANLRKTVLDAAGRIEADPKEQHSERMKQMIAMRAEKFFLELEEVVSATLDKMGLPDANN